MPEGTYESRVRIARGIGDQLTAELPGSERARFGVHDGIAHLDPGAGSSALPAPTSIDYLVASVGACLVSTFAGALAAWGINADGDRLTATAVGDAEPEARVLVLRRVHVTYELAVDEDTDVDVVQRVLRVHADACAVYRSVHPQVLVTTSLEFA